MKRRDDRRPAARGAGEFGGMLPRGAGGVWRSVAERGRGSLAACCRGAQEESGGMLPRGRGSQAACCREEQAYKSVRQSAYGKVICSCLRAITVPVKSIVSYKKRLSDFDPTAVCIFAVFPILYVKKRTFIFMEDERAVFFSVLFSMILNNKNERKFSIFSHFQWCE